MKPYYHAVTSAKKYGGVPEDYLEIHNFMDSSKIAYADIAHRAILHSSFGVYLAEQMFGVVFKNSEDKIVNTRDIAEQHVYQDLGFIPTLKDWVGDLPIKEWMKGIAAQPKQVRKMTWELQKD